MQNITFTKILVKEDGVQILEEDVVVQCALEMPGTLQHNLRASQGSWPELAVLDGWQDGILEFYMYHAFVYSNIIPSSPHADHQGNPDCHSRHCLAHLCDGKSHNPRRTLPELPPRELPDIFFYNQSDWLLYSFILWSILLFLTKYQGVVEIRATSTTMMTIRMFGPLELKHTAWGNTFKLKIA